MKNKKIEIFDKKYVDILRSDNNKAFVNNAGQFFQSKISTRSYKKKMDDDSCLKSKPYMNLTKTKLRYMDIDQQLKEKREYRDLKRKELNEQWKKLEENERKFRLEFIYFHKFIKENMDKRERSLQKADENRAIIINRDIAIDDLKEELNGFKALKESMEKKIKKYIIFEKYLTEVVRSFPNQFTCINEVLNRYSTLKDIKDFLGKKQLLQITTGLEAQKTMSKMVEEQKLKIIGMKTHVLNLQLRLQTAVEKEKSCEIMLNTILYHIILGIINKIKVSCSAWNMYKSIATTKNLPMLLSRHELEEQLIFIKRNLLEIESINKIIVPNFCASQSTLFSKKSYH